MNHYMFSLNKGLMENICKTADPRKKAHGLSMFIITTVLLPAFQFILPYVISLSMSFRSDLCIVKDRLLVQAGC